MKNIVEVAAWFYIIKSILPVVLGIGFVVVVVTGEFLDGATDRTYDGTKLRIRNRK